MTHSNLIHDAEPALGIAKLADTALPFNRKERYFTGTVLPMLVCTHNFAYLGRLTTFSDVGAPYFVETLRIALERYNALVSRTQYGANAEFRLRGELIVDKYLSGQMVNCWMGRRNGLNGDELQSDITTGSWRAFTYECSSTPVDNRN